jgi:heterotetrameric sarcosine oxidase gamma subunit
MARLDVSDERRVPPRARAVVIGGGVVGCSIAYHLAHLGWRDVLLLEQGRLSCGTTWHSVGVVSQLRSQRSLTKLSLASIELYERLGREAGLDTGWNRCGGLAVARTEERLTQLLRGAALGRTLGVQGERISLQEAQALWPLMRTDDLAGAVWSPGDGKVNAIDLTQALARGARLAGARIVEGLGVRDIQVENGAVSGVVTTTGDVIECEVVVNAAGQWSKKVGALAGVTVPLHPTEHFYVITDAVEGIRPHMPAVRDPDGWTYFKDEGDGILVGGFEPVAQPWVSSEDIPEHFEFQLLPENWEQFSVIMENAIVRIPVLEKTGIRKMFNGPESFTPDSTLIMGEAPEVRGFFVACGFNSSGVGYAGGVGLALAEWIVSGEPTLDLSSVDIRRFAPYFGNTTWLRERVQESEGMHFALPWPNKEPVTARPLRRSPLYEPLVRAGVCFGTKMGWERPNWFAPAGVEPEVSFSFGRQNWFPFVREEHLATRERIALFDLSSFAKFILKGPDAETVMQCLCSNDVAVPPGRIVYTAILNDHAGYESDLTVTRISEDEFLIVTGAGQATRDFAWIERALGHTVRAQLVDVTAAYSVLSLMGPRSRALLEALSPDRFDSDAFPFASSREIQLGRATCRATRITNVGELGWELHVGADMALTVYEHLMEAGADFGLTNAGYYALDSLRLEKGYRAWGRELTPDVTPLEAGLLFACKLKTAVPFRGREALERQLTGGSHRRLAIFVLDDPEPILWGGEVILRDDETVGFTTSGAFGHTLERSVAFGYVEREGREWIDERWLKEGQYAIESATELHSATLHLRPPYDPTGSRVKS